MSITIETAFPQISRINEPDLRKRVVRCWDEAMRRGGWELDDLEKIPFSLLAPTVGVSLAAHTRAVTDSSLALGKVLDKAYRHIFRINFDHLAAGGLLHDVGKPLEYRRTESGYGVSENGRLLRHPISGAALAAELGLPPAVQHIIAVHSKEGDGGYRSPEAWIVHHADFVNFEPLRNK